MFKGLSSLGFVLPLGVLAITGLWVGYSVVLKNLNAKDLVFSYTALAAALVMFILNVALTLKNEEEHKLVNVHFVLSPEGIDLYPSVASRSNYALVMRDQLNDFFGFKGVAPTISPPSFTQDERADFKRKLSEYLRLSIVGEMLSSYPDWEPRVRSFRSSYNIQYNARADGAGENTFISLGELAKNFSFDHPLLLQTGMFMTDGLTLPPKTTLLSDGENIVFDNEYTRIEISFDIADSMTFAVPRISEKWGMILDQSDLSIGVTNVEANIILNIQHKKQRFGDPDRERYVSWGNNIRQLIEKSFSIKIN